MFGLSYDLPSYRSYLRFSNEKHLLVEGRDDKRVFALFLDELLVRRGAQSMRYGIRIDCAEALIDFGSKVGNREKVEVVCRSVSDLSFAEKLVGFVDRDFREFDRHPCLQDRVGGHLVSGRLVWSRGHSVENYYFDFDTLRNPLRAFSVTDRFCQALGLFEVIFEQTIRLACSASLAGDELQILKIVKKSATREIFQLHSGKEEILTLNLDVWRKNLKKHHRLSPDMADELIERFQGWNNPVEASDFCIVRWMCHGHIGLAFIWAVYSLCVLEVCQREGYDRLVAESEAQRVLKSEESVRFSACADFWVQRALGNHCDYPAEVFKLLGLDVQAT